VRALSGVANAQLASEDGSRSRIQIESETGRDMRVEVARTLVNNGWGLLELRSETMSLEDIFIKLTTAEDTTPSIASAS
jgi:ABC-2 type transport system ATP-binding protein